MPEYDSNGKIDSKVCTKCNTRTRMEYIVVSKAVCRTCENKICGARRNTIRGFLQNLCNRAKNSAKRRSNIRSRNDDSHEVADNLFDLVVDLIIQQCGRCNITGHPLAFKPSRRILKRHARDEANIPASKKRQ